MLIHYGETESRVLHAFYHVDVLVAELYEAFKQFIGAKASMEFHFRITFDIVDLYL